MGDTEKCSLITTTFAALMQVVLLVVAISSLVIKRAKFEHPKRPFCVWALDVSKNCHNAGLVHFVNIGFAALLAHFGGEHNSDECGWYFTFYLVDMLITVPLSYVFLQVFQRLARSRDWHCVATSGFYPSLPYNTRYCNDSTFCGKIVCCHCCDSCHWCQPWWCQMLAWDLVILVAKAFSFTVIWFLVKPMGQFSDWLMTPLQPHPKTELVVVLILCPCVMNTIQFWIFDNILKRKRPGTIAYSAYFSDEQGAGMGLGSIPLVHRDSDQMAGMEEDLDQAFDAEIDALDDPHAGMSADHRKRLMYYDS